MYKPAKYRKKPVEIEAMFHDGSETSARAIVNWLRLHDTMAFRPTNITVVIPTLEGEMNASAPCYVIKGVAGEFYPCAVDIFRKTYEPIA